MTPAESTTSEANPRVAIFRDGWLDLIGRPVDLLPVRRHVLGFQQVSWIERSDMVPRRFVRSMLYLLVSIQRYFGLTHKIWSLIPC